MQELRVVAAANDDVLISETARRLGISPSQGWDIFRRIKRAAEKRELKAYQRAFPSIPDCARDSNSEMAPPMEPVQHFVRAVLVDNLHFYELLAALSVNFGFNNFYNTLTQDEQQKLIDLDLAGS